MTMLILAIFMFRFIVSAPQISAVPDDVLEIAMSFLSVADCYSVSLTHRKFNQSVFGVQSKHINELTTLIRDLANDESPITVKEQLLHYNVDLFQLLFGTGCLSSRTEYLGHARSHDSMLALFDIDRIQVIAICYIQNPLFVHELPMMLSTIQRANLSDEDKMIMLDLIGVLSHRSQCAVTVECGINWRQIQKL